MKKFLIMIAAFAMTTMFVQANEEIDTKDMAVQAVQEATDTAPATEGDENTTEEAPTEEK